jgi:hypothetical protein
VGKIVSRKGQDDEVSFSVYGESDELGYAEPTVWQVRSQGLRLMANLDLVILSSTGREPRVIDELRLGPTWRSVVPMKSNEL